MKYRTAIPYYLKSAPTLWQGLKLKTALGAMLGKKSVVRLKNGMRLWVKEPMDIWVIKEVVLDKDYEKYYRVLPGDVVIDIGASLGEFAIMVGRRAKQVYSYEIADAEIELMRANLKLNPSRNIKLIQMEVTNLDEIFKKEKIKKCQLLKIDCEGAEYPIFERTSEAVLVKIEHIAMEAHWFLPEQRRQYAKLVKRFKGSGFEVKEVPNPVHENIGYLWAGRV